MSGEGGENEATLASRGLGEEEALAAEVRGSPPTGTKGATARECFKERKGHVPGTADRSRMKRLQSDRGT